MEGIHSTSNPMEELVEKAKEMFEPACEQSCRQYVIIAILWLLWLAIFSMNYIAYFHDYARYSDEIFVMGISFKTFSLLAGLTAVVLDVVTLWGLLGNTPVLEKIPSGVRIAIVAVLAGIGISVIIYTHVVNTPRELEKKDKDPILSQRHHRIVLYSVILVIDLIMVLLQFTFDRNEIGFEFSGGAGGCVKSGTSFGNILGLIFGLGGVATDALALRTQANYNPEKYNLPKHFD